MINQKSLLIGLLAGLATTVMSIGANGGTPLAIPLFILSPLAILIAGLGWGTITAVIASIVTAVLLGTFSTVPHAAVSAMLTLAPATWSAHMAGLCRHDDNGEEWYPLSEILFRLSIYLAAAFCVIGYFVNFNIADVAQLIEQVYRTVIDVNQINIPAAEIDANISAIAKFYASLLPYTMPAFWLLMFVINLQLAAKITRASGMMLRPQDDIPYSASFPKLAIGLCFIAFAIATIDSPVGQFAATFAGSLMMGFALIALAFVHAITRGKNFRMPVLIAVYFAAVLFGFPLFVLSLVGIGETLFNWRYRQNQPQV